MQIVLAILLLAGVYVLTRFAQAWRIKRATFFIIRDLEMKKAFGPDTAVQLPYAKSDWFKIGLRDFKPRALESLVNDGILGKTPQGRYYLKRKLEDLLPNRA